jgi:predicted ATP-grasp superfamily ATP-dependent carboligase
MTDITMQLAAVAHKALGRRVRWPFPEEEQVRWVQDKRHMLLMAERVGIACPRTFMMSEDENLEDVSRKITYPAVIKPRFSRFLRDRVWASGSVQYAGGREELIAKYHESSVRIPGPLVQERIVGEGRGVFLLVWDGKLKAAFGHRRLREKPPWGGVSVCCESVRLDEDLVQKALALLQAVGWQGVAMVEFKVDRRDGQPKLMEVNGRFWGSLQLAIDAGMDFPLLLHRLAMGEKMPPQLEYKVGVMSRWLLGDLDHLLIRFRHPRGPAGITEDSGSRLVACLKFLNFFERNSRLDVVRFDDLRPGWFELKHYVRESLHGFSWRRAPASIPGRTVHTVSGGAESKPPTDHVTPS